MNLCAWPLLCLCLCPCPCTSIALGVISLSWYTAVYSGSIGTPDKTPTTITQQFYANSCHSRKIFRYFTHTDSILRVKLFYYCLKKQKEFSFLSFIYPSSHTHVANTQIWAHTHTVKPILFQMKLFHRWRQKTTSNFFMISTPDFYTSMTHQPKQWKI